MPSLRLQRETGKPQVFSIFKHVTSIGSEKSNDAVLPKEMVVDFHAQIVFDGKEFYLEEVDKKADIQVNGKKKRRGKLMHGDRIKLDQAELLFSVFDESKARPATEMPETLSQTHAAQHSAQIRGEQFSNEGLRKLQEFSEKIGQARSIDEQLEVLVDGILEVTHAQKAFLLTVENETARISVARNIDGKDLPESIEQLSDSILKRVVETQKPLIVSDAIADTMFGKSESVLNLQLSSVMCAPIFVHGELLGLLYLGNDAVRSLFDHRSLEVLSVFISQASLLIQSSQLVERLRAQRDRLVREVESSKAGDMVGTHPSMEAVVKQIDRVAQTSVTVLVTGETGTGKELVAHAIHKRSHRAEGPFIVVNCGAIPENLMESEFFGHVRGAFTGAVSTRGGKFQAAHGGTLFLDEIGEMPLSLQAKMLRALQEKVVLKVGDTKPERVDVRIVAATHRTLEDEVKKGTFREDLFYRLAVVTLHLPPLRERGEDVVLLAQALLAKYAKELGVQVKGYTPSALAAIRKYEWPGNVRQLENRIKKALVMSERSLLSADDLDLYEEALAPVRTLVQAKEEFQRRYVLEVLERNQGNRTQTARDLGVDPRTIFRYLEREG